jgi:hypothetical protein
MLRSTINIEINHNHPKSSDEIFSTVAMFKSIRMLLVIATFHDYEI